MTALEDRKTQMKSRICICCGEVMSAVPNVHFIENPNICFDCNELEVVAEESSREEILKPRFDHDRGLGVLTAKRYENDRTEDPGSESLSGSY